MRGRSRHASGDADNPHAIAGSKPQVHFSNHPAEMMQPYSGVEDGAAMGMSGWSSVAYSPNHGFEEPLKKKYTIHDPSGAVPRRPTSASYISSSNSTSDFSSVPSALSHSRPPSQPAPLPRRPPSSYSSSSSARFDTSSPSKGSGRGVSAKGLQAAVTKPGAPPTDVLYALLCRKCDKLEGTNEF